MYTNCDEVTYMECMPDVSGPWFLNNLETDTDYLIRVWNSGGPSAGSFAICIETDFSTGATTTGSTTLPLIHPNPARSVLFIDQLPECLLPLVVLREALPLSWTDLLLLAVLFVPANLIANRSWEWVLTHRRRASPR